MRYARRYLSKFQADILFRRLNGKSPVCIGGYPNLKLSAILLGCQEFGHYLTTARKILHHIGNILPDSFQSIFRCLVKPIQTWELGTQANMFLFAPLVHYCAIVRAWCKFPLHMYSTCTRLSRR
jgi:hypothetical protein